MSIPKDGYYIAWVQHDTGGECADYVRVKEGKLYSRWGGQLLPEACSDFQEVETTLIMHVWPEDAAMELQALRTANAGLLEKVKRLEEAGDRMAIAVDGEARTWGLKESDHGNLWRKAKGQP